MSSPMAREAFAEFNVRGVLAVRFGSASLAQATPTSVSRRSPVSIGGWRLMLLSLQGGPMREAGVC